uniref:H15 domain-containing protein n=1 Tax=Periophthalmus magnuspinnatus TaxID=409849 RepID=A0A3B3ZVM8_9GOBI
MAETAPAPAPAPAKAKAPKKKAAAKKKDGPNLQKLIIAEITASKERKGVSVAALKKALAAKGVDVTKANKRINTTLKKMVTSGAVSQTKGTGASGSFKLAKTEAKCQEASPLQARDRGSEGDPPLRSPHRAAHPQTALPASGQGDRPGLQNRPAFPELRRHGSAGGQRGLPGGSV